MQTEIIKTENQRLININKQIRNVIQAQQIRTLRFTIKGTLHEPCQLLIEGGEPLIGPQYEPQCA